MVFETHKMLERSPVPLLIFEFINKYNKYFQIYIIP